MGYCMSQCGADFRVRAENIKPLRKALIEAFPNRNCLWGKPIEKLPIEDIFVDFGWDISFGDECQIESIHFVGEKASCEDDDFMRAIAPFVEDMSYIEMQGEEGEIWRWYFEEGKAYEWQASIRFEPHRRREL